ncbi:MAG: hypothetical protein A2Y63_05630 [Candidatus Riflebacteria bacterium RBG_13_59_9]|nr:MAG: hypothetical protein A2Y63_05630 [Candidatus Riflebacteria bacterium RBG_13_59_9]
MSRTVRRQRSQERPSVGYKKSEAKRNERRPIRYAKDFPYSDKELRGYDRKEGEDLDEDEQVEFERVLKTTGHL